MQVLEDAEITLQIVHRHWFYLLKEIFVFGVLAIAPFFAAVFFFELNIDRIIALPGETLFFVIGGIFLWFLFVLPIVFVVWTDYFLDTLIITDRRIVDVEQKGLFAREVSSFRLDRVQDVTIEINGIIATLLDFGTIHIQTAGDAREFTAKFIPKPEEVKKAVLHEHYKAVERTGSNF